MQAIPPTIPPPGATRRKVGVGVTLNPLQGQKSNVRPTPQSLENLTAQLEPPKKELKKVNSNVTVVSASVTSKIGISNLTTDTPTFSNILNDGVDITTTSPIKEKNSTAAAVTTTITPVKIWSQNKATSTIKKVLYESQMIAPSPGQTYYQISVEPPHFFIREWPRARFSSKWTRDGNLNPTEQKLTLTDFLIDPDMKSKIIRIFGTETYELSIISIKEYLKTQSNDELQIILSNSDTQTNADNNKLIKLINSDANIIPGTRISETKKIESSSSLDSAKFRYNADIAY